MRKERAGVRAEEPCRFSLKNVTKWFPSGYVTSTSSGLLNLLFFMVAMTRCLIFFFVLCWKQFHQYQVVGRALPTESDEHPKIYRMKLWATNEVRSKSKFWYVYSHPFVIILILTFFESYLCILL